MKGAKIMVLFQVLKYLILIKLLMVVPLGNARASVSIETLERELLKAVNITKYDMATGSADCFFYNISDGKPHLGIGGAFFAAQNPKVYEKYQYIRPEVWSLVSIGKNNFKLFLSKYVELQIRSSGGDASKALRATMLADKHDRECMSKFASLALLVADLSDYVYKNNLYHRSIWIKTPQAAIQGSKGRAIIQSTLNDGKRFFETAFELAKNQFLSRGATVPLEPPTRPVRSATKSLIDKKDAKSKPTDSKSFGENKSTVSSSTPPRQSEIDPEPVSSKELDATLIKVQKLFERLD